MDFRTDQGKKTLEEPNILGELNELFKEIPVKEWIKSKYKD